MSFLVGKNEQKSNVSPESADMFKQLISYIQGQGFAGLNPGTTVDAASAAPYEKMFADRNAMTFGQAKESAGNLTGSGLGNSLGTAAARASTEQGGFLANLFENRRQQDAARFLQLVLGVGNNQSVGVHDVHTPGLLEYGAQGLSAAAPFLAGGAGAKVAGTGGGAAPVAAGMDSPNQLGQASRYFFNGTHVPPDVYGNPYGGWGSGRDGFGTSRSYK